MLAIDVHTPGIGHLLEAIERDHLTNVRVIDGDASVFVERIPAAILSEIRILFPDPWPKSVSGTAGSCVPTSSPP